MSMVTVHGPHTMYETEEQLAQAGTPGAFAGGAGLIDAADITELRAEVQPFPTTDRWVDGQYIVLVDASEAYWDGNSWEVGRAPAGTITNVTAGIPGEFTPAGYYPDLLFANITALRADAYVGTTGSATTGDAAWTIGQYVVLANAAQVYWNGTGWTTGTAP